MLSRLTSSASRGTIRRSFGSAAAEDAAFQLRADELKQQWATSDRWTNATREYTAEDVVSLQGSVAPLAPANLAASRKLWALNKTAKAAGECMSTWGAIDPVQVAQMAKYQSTVYCSGWQTSSVSPSNALFGPDLADYPYDSVPKVVERLFQAQHFHDRKQYEERRRMTAQQRLDTPAVDFLNPIVADGDTGHGGLTAVAKLTSMMVTCGASGIHLEDQRAGGEGLRITACTAVIRVKTSRLTA